MHDGIVRVGAVADLHYTRTSQGTLLPVFEQVGRLADVLLLGGDLTDLGLPEEAHVLTRDLKAWPYKPDTAVPLPTLPDGGTFPMDWNRHGKKTVGNSPTDPSMPW